MGEADREALRQRKEREKAQGREFSDMIRARYRAQEEAKLNELFGTERRNEKPDDAA